MEFESFTLVFLRRPPGAPDLPQEELERIQAEHLGHLERMGRKGLLIAGPFSDQPDETFRGLCLYSTPLDETRELANQDPAVLAGRLAVDVMTWWVPAGRLSFPSSGPSD